LRDLALAGAREVGVFLLFAAWAAVVTRPLALRLTTHMLPGPDPISHLWMVNWITGHAFQPGQIFQGNIFYPAPHAVLHTDLSMGTAILALPFRLFVHEPMVLFNVATLLALAFAGWAFHALVFGVTGHRWAGILSGLLAAFSPEQLSHVYHLNLLSIGWLPLALLGLHRIVEGGRPWAIVLAGVALALNAQSSGYYAVASVVVVAVFLAFHARALRRPRILGALAAAGLLAAVLTLPYLHEFLELRDEQGGLRRPAQMSVNMAFQPARDLKTIGLLYGSVLGREEGLFPGLLIPVLVAVALWRRGREAAFYVTAAAVLVVMSMGPEITLGGLKIPMPYRWLFAVPPLDSMRHPYTLAAVALMLLAVAAGIGWARLGLASRRWSGLAVLAVAIVETLTPPPDLRAVPPGVPPAYEALASLPRSWKCRSSPRTPCSGRRGMGGRCSTARARSRRCRRSSSSATSATTGWKPSPPTWTRHGRRRTSWTASPSATSSCPRDGWRTSKAWPRPSIARGPIAWWRWRPTATASTKCAARSRSDGQRGARRSATVTGPRRARAVPSVVT
jgi:hypothetical protein